MTPTNPKWVTWSMTPHSENEIREAVFNTPELICWSYVCRYSPLSEAFIEEALVLSTGLFDGVSGETYSEQNKKLVRDILFIEPTRERANKQYEIVNKVYQSLKDKTIADRILSRSMSIWARVDWYQIASFQDISPEFKKKFRQQFIKAKINSEAKFKENKREQYYA